MSASRPLYILLLLVYFHPVPSYSWLIKLNLKVEALQGPNRELSLELNFGYYVFILNVRYVGLSIHNYILYEILMILGEDRKDWMRDANRTT